MNSETISDEDYGYGYRRLGRKLSEISEEEEEDDDSTDLFEINRLSAVGGDMMRDEFEMSSLFSFDVEGFGGEMEDCVYVAVGMGDTSMDALTWTLRDIVAGQDTAKPPSTAVCLVHVFPLIQSVPTPLGNIPIRTVIPEQVETHKAQERYKKRQMLQKFVTCCIASKVKVDTILIESDRVAKSIVELISMLNITKIVLGTSKYNLRRFVSKKGNGDIADQVFRKASESCQVKIVCKGKEVVLEMETESSVGSSGDEVWDSRSGKGEEVHCMEFFSCTCLNPRTML